MLSGLRLRMTAITAGAMLIVLAVLAIGVLAVSSQVFRQETENRLEATAGSTAQEVSLRGAPIVLSERTRYDPAIFFLAWFPSGDNYAHRNDIDPAPFRPLALRALDRQVHVDTLHVNHSTLLVDSRLVQERTDGDVYVIQTVTSLDSVTAVQNRMLTVVALAGGAALVVTAIAAWFVAGRAAAPVEAALRRQRQFTADASHELRTPLTIIDASLQVLRRHPDRKLSENQDVVEGAEREVRRMGRLVDDMLTLARADAGVLELQPEPTDVDEMIRQVVGDLAGRAEAERHPVSAGHLGAGTIVVDPALLRQLLLILVDNALVHTPEGTPVEVSAGRRSGELVLAVTDSGPGIPLEARERVFERFRRNLAGRPGEGAGLGLPIARELATRAGGAVRLGDNRPGLRAEIILPAAGGRVGSADHRWRPWRRWLPLAES